MEIFQLIISVLQKVWLFAYNTKMPLFDNLTIAQFCILFALMTLVLNFIKGVMSNEGGDKGD